MDARRTSRRRAAALTGHPGQPSILLAHHLHHLCLLLGLSHFLH
jgi:hypothetical protein